MLQLSLLLAVVAVLPLLGPPPPPLHWARGRPLCLTPAPLRALFQHLQARLPLLLPLLLLLPVAAPLAIPRPHRARACCGRRPNLGMP
jgi:hypothetical protein